MAVAEPQKHLGSYTVYTSSGATVTVRLGIGSVFILHEYAAAAGGPTVPLFVNGAWKTSSSQRIFVDGAWKPITSGKIFINGAWKAIS